MLISLSLWNLDDYFLNFQGMKLQLCKLDFPLRPVLNYFPLFEQVLGTVCVTHHCFGMDDFASGYFWQTELLYLLLYAHKHKRMGLKPQPSLNNESWGRKLTFNIDNQLTKNSLARRAESHFVITLLNGVKRKNIVTNKHTKSWTNTGCLCQLQLRKFVAIFISSSSHDRFIGGLEFLFLTTLVIRYLKKTQNNNNNKQT